MPRSIYSERQFQNDFIDYLVNEDGYVYRGKNEHSDRAHAMDPDLLFEFLDATQHETLDAFRLHFKTEEDMRGALVEAIWASSCGRRKSRLRVLQNGISPVAGIRFNLMYTKPDAPFNDALNEAYGRNILSVAQEVYADTDNRQRIDVVLYLNGIAFATFELKDELAGQSALVDGQAQYKKDRNPSLAYLRPMAGPIVHFTMDLSEVYMATRLQRERTTFLPFNMGLGQGIECGAGNPIPADGSHPTHYMWDHILTRDVIIEILGRYAEHQEKDEVDPETGRRSHSETIIFPRYHQFDAVDSLTADMRANGTSLNYLIQHSPGSGKTNEIVWLAGHLASLYMGDGTKAYDQVIVMTDRRAVDRQLQAALRRAERKSGTLEVIGEGKHSEDLAKALMGGAKIVVSTIQKFGFALDSLKKVPGRRFAVIIDEAHSSTAGENMDSVRKALSNDDDAVQDYIARELSRTGSLDNVSFVAFTATPKPKTLKMFGRLNAHGQYEAFHVYSLKQAIEEGYCIDPLSNYVTYNTYYQLNKDIESDPRYDTWRAKVAIARWVALSDENLSEKARIAVMHFRENVLGKSIGGDEKGMFISFSRMGAALTFLHAKALIAEEGYDEVRPCVAFTGKLSLPNGLLLDAGYDLGGTDAEPVDRDGTTEATEAWLNGVAESKLPERFDTRSLNLMFAADKYQTGYDQPKLCAMYVDKSLRKVAAVQTLCRLDRPYKPGTYRKQVVVIDFRNGYDAIRKAFAPYYASTRLSGTVRPEQLYDLYDRLEGFYVYDADDVDKVRKVIEGSDGKPSAKDMRTVATIAQRTLRQISKLDDDERKEFRITLNSFLSAYEFMSKVVGLDDEDMMATYWFGSVVLRKALEAKGATPERISVDGELSIRMLSVERAGGHGTKEKGRKGRRKVADPVLSLSTADAATRIPQSRVDLLSRIVAELNAENRFIKNPDAAVSSLASLVAFLQSNDGLRESARNNSLADFWEPFKDSFKQAMVDNYQQSADLFGFLLADMENNGGEGHANDLMRAVLRTVYDGLRTE